MRLHWLRSYGALALFTVLSSSFFPQDNVGEIQGTVIRADSMEGVSDVQITLRGPFPVATLESLASFYTPNTALTPAMQEEIDALIATAPTGVPLELTARQVINLEAQLLGLPERQANPGAQSRPPARNLQVETDANGDFAFSGLAPGAYQVSAQRAGYLGVPVRGTPGRLLFSQVTTVSVSLTVGQRASRTDFMMVREGTIGGRIVNSRSQPIPLARISAYRVIPDAQPVLVSAASKQTDDRGEYRLYGLPPGTYYVSATLESPPPGRSIDRYVPIFFPGTADPQAARTIKIGEGDDLDHIDFSVDSIESITISGQFVAATPNEGNNPAPLADTFILAPRVTDTPWDRQLQVRPNTAQEASKGHFEIKGVRPGSYDLIATSAQDFGVVMGQARVEVGVEDVHNVMLTRPDIEIRARLIVNGSRPPSTMAPAQKVGFRFSDFGGSWAVMTRPVPRSPTPVPSSTIQLTLRPIKSAPRLSWMATTAWQDTKFDPSGIFVFPKVVDGRYTIEVTHLPPLAYVSDIRVGDKSVYDDGFVASEVQGELTVTVQSNGGEIHGRVHDANGKAFRDARVVLAPTLSHRQNASLYKSVFADITGNFTIRGIAPGNYRMFAWDVVLDGAWMNPDVLNSYESLGRSVTVREGAITETDLTVMAANPDHR